MGITNIINTGGQRVAFIYDGANVLVFFRVPPQYSAHSIYSFDKYFSLYSLPHITVDRMLKIKLSSITNRSHFSGKHCVLL